MAGLTKQLPVVFGHGHRLQRFVALGALETHLVELSASSEHFFVHVDRLVTERAFGTAAVAHPASL